MTKYPKVIKDDLKKLDPKDVLRITEVMLGDATRHRNGSVIDYYLEIKRSLGIK